MTEVVVMCATACFDIGYKVFDIFDDEGDTAQEKCQRFLPPVSVYNGCLAWRIVKSTYHSSVEWLIADVTDVSNLHQLSVFHA